MIWRKTQILLIKMDNKVFWPLKYKQKDRKQIKDTKALIRELRAEKTNMRKLSLIADGNKYLV